ncbi:MAG TPA: hypothetical protein VF115_09755 [Acidimicrobiia bacterium]
MRRWAIPVALALVAAACGSGTGPDAAPADDAIPNCADLSPISADPSLYRDTPKYVGNEMPVDEVRRWATQHRGFEGIWIDRDHNGWVTVAFSQDAEQRQADVQQEFPDDGVVVVSVDWTEEQLMELQERVIDELTGVVDVAGVGSPTNYGVVSVFINVLTEEAIAEVESRFAGEPLCVEGKDPADAVAPGPQPDGGDGWRLILAERGVGEVYRTGIAWDQTSLLDLMESIPGLGDTDFDVDFESEVVVWFGAVYGSSCPNLRLDDVIVERNTVYPMIVNPDNPGACTDDANPYTFMVGVDRDRLPGPPFHIQLGPADPPPGVPEERTVVHADLREPGTTAGADEVGFDPNLPEPRPERSGTIIEPGYPWEYEIDLTCGWEWLGEINSYQWVASSPIPQAWLDATDGQDSVVVQVTLNEGDPDPFVEVAFADQSVIYTIGDLPAC